MPNVAVITSSYDNYRSGCNYNETRFTPTFIKQNGLHRVKRVPLVGKDKRGAEAQLLLAPNVTCCDNQVHDVLVATNMAGTLEGQDADTGEVVWVTRIGNPIQGSGQIDGYELNDHWGPLSTPALDLEALYAYLVMWESPDGDWRKGTHAIHCYDLRNGQRVGKPVSLEGVTYTPPGTKYTQKFVSAERKQRSGLGFATISGYKTVIVASGSIAESASSNQGWLIAYDVTTSILTGFCMCPRGSGGGIWMAGQAPAIDDNGLIYTLNGNGSFDGITDFGECLHQAGYVPPLLAADKKTGVIKSVSHFAPFTDAGRMGKGATVGFMAEEDETAVDPATPSNTMNMPDMPGMTMPMAKPKRYLTNIRKRATSRIDGAWADMDLGSAGILLLPKRGLAVASGKDGILYIAYMKNLGSNKLADFANIDKMTDLLAAKPIWFSFHPGPNITAYPQDPTELNRYYFNQTHHVHSTPCHYESKKHGDMLFCQGENGVLRAWQIDANNQPIFLAQGTVVASAESPTPYGGMPGGMLTMTSNQGVDGIVWAVVPYGNANTEITNGRLTLYDAENFVKVNGEMQIPILWDSQTWGVEFVYNKFGKIITSSGRAFYATYDNIVDYYL